ncbi:hypothetical protein HELRODRAFT_195014 [Helobdella robusta]|uniref:Ig-like domain-containing protein n=1 Tax=Helobdella robusta TaxID=6412 RepID=T1FWN5_HELRO|nr:hypothetical protein HELRODRAFT_195014 [Helobdella robusta]ESO09782.1 hypothetical protein HELRODRAFT_195014 [Helobdella robusta]
MEMLTITMLLVVDHIISTVHCDPMTTAVGNNATTSDADEYVNFRMRESLYNFDKTIFVGLVGTTKVIPLFLNAKLPDSEFTDIVISKEGNSIATCTKSKIQCVPSASNNLTTDNVKVYFEGVQVINIQITNVTMQDAGFYDASGGGDEMEVAAELMVVDKPQCEAGLYQGEANDTELLTENMTVVEFSTLKLHCRLEYRVTPTSIKPILEWSSGPETVVNVGKNATDRKGWLTINNYVSVDHLTNFSQLRCHMFVPVTKKQLGSLDFGNTEKEKSWRTVDDPDPIDLYCDIPEPTIAFCPSEVSITEKVFTNGTRLLVCRAPSYPPSQYVWESTNQVFEPTISNQVIVERAGYYTCTAKYPINPYNIECRSKLGLHLVTLMAAGTFHIMVISFLTISGFFILVSIGFAIKGLVDKKPPDFLKRKPQKTFKREDIRISGLSQEKSETFDPNRPKAIKFTGGPETN